LGSQFYFPTSKINITIGDFDQYAYETASGGKVEVERCSIYGTSLFWKIRLEELRGLKGTAGGSYDPPTFWYKIEHEVFVRSKARFCTIEAPESYLESFSSPYMKEEEPRLTGG
jgi:hypothetical protein